MRWVGRKARRTRKSEREDGDGRKEDLPRTVGAGAPRWVPAGPCTDEMERHAASHAVVYIALIQLHKLTNVP